MEDITAFPAVQDYIRLRKQGASHFNASTYAVHQHGVTMDELSRALRERRTELEGTLALLPRASVEQAVPYAPPPPPYRGTNFIEQARNAEGGDSVVFIEAHDPAKWEGDN